MKKINLYLILAPFQLLSAIENIDRSGGAEAWLMIRGTKTSRNFDQILAILDESDWDRIIYLNRSSDVLALLGLLKYKIYFICGHAQVLNFNIGEFRSKLCQWAVRIISPVKIGILDDGVATLAFYSPGEDGIEGLDRQEELKELSPILFRFSKKHRLILKSFLTLPDSQYWTIEKYGFQKFRKKYISQNYSSDEMMCFFLGPSMSKMGTGVWSVILISASRFLISFQEKK